MEQPTITTFSNVDFNFLDPKPEQINIVDIAQALSMTCRYSGHVDRFYSVAEHSCHVSDLVHAKTRCREKAFSALMHDASEAYLNDIPRPIKPYLSEYGVMEARVQAAIEAKFHAFPMCEVAKYIDTHIVAEEARQLFRQVPSWYSEYDHVHITLENWEPFAARTQFLMRFNSLRPQRMGEAA